MRLSPFGWSSGIIGSRVVAHHLFHLCLALPVLASTESAKLSAGCSIVGIVQHPPALIFAKGPLSEEPLSRKLQISSPAISTTLKASLPKWIGFRLFFASFGCPFIDLVRFVHHWKGMNVNIALALCCTPSRTRSFARIRGSRAASLYICKTMIQDGCSRHISDMF